MPEPRSHDEWPNLAASRAFDSTGARHYTSEDDAVADAESLEDDAMSIVDERGYGGENRDEARRELQRIGMEAIACYRPIHFQGRERWGIYLHERLFFGACAELAASLGAAHWHEIVADLLDSVYQHELFHGAVELFGLVVEDFSICGGSHACLYKAYFENDYQRTYPTADCLGLKQASAEG